MIFNILKMVFILLLFFANGFMINERGWFAAKEIAEEQEIAEEEKYVEEFLTDTASAIGLPDSVAIEIDTVNVSPIELKLNEMGMVNILDLENSILVELKYSSTDNFLGEDVYGDFEKAFMRFEVAFKLMDAQHILKEINPNYKLLVYDAVRPRFVQYKMWEIVKDTDMQRYVAPPGSGSLHNYGAAVDLTIADENGVALDMGTPFDFFGELAQPRYEKKYLKTGDLTKEQVENRKLLRLVMGDAGFSGIRGEWWHFNGLTMKEVRSKFKMVEL